MTDKKHIGDPCIFCDTHHDDVAIGDCPGGNIVRRGHAFKEIVITDSEGVLIASISDKDIVTRDGIQIHFLEEFGQYKDAENGIVIFLGSPK